MRGIQQNWRVCVLCVARQREHLPSSRSFCFFHCAALFRAQACTEFRMNIRTTSKQIG